MLVNSEFRMELGKLDVCDKGIPDGMIDGHNDSILGGIKLGKVDTVDVKNDGIFDASDDEIFDGMRLGKLDTCDEVSMDGMLDG